MITIYGVPGSPYGRAAMIALLEKRIPHRLQPIGPADSKSPAHLARHPFGRMPAIDDDGFVLYETQAILRYADQIGAGPSLTPSDPKAQARMNQAIGVIDWYFFADGSAKTLVFNRVVAPKFGMPTNEAAVADSLTKTRHCVDVFAGFLESGPYVAGDAFSLADIHAGTQLNMLADCAEGAEMVKGTPIAPWLERLNARPSFRETTWDRLLQAA